MSAPAITTGPTESATNDSGAGVTSDGTTPPNPDLRRLCIHHAHRATAALRAQGFAPDFDDAMAGAMYGAWRAEQTYDESRGTSLTTWAWLWVKRYATIEARRSAGLTVRGDGPHFYSIEGHDFEDEGPDQNDAEAVRIAVLDLPDPERSAVWLRYWRGMELAEVGRYIGQSKSGARAVLGRAHRKLAEKLSA